MDNVKKETPKREIGGLEELMAVLNSNWERFPERIKGQIEGCVYSGLTLCKEPYKAS